MQRHLTNSPQTALFREIPLWGLTFVALVAGRADATETEQVKRLQNTVGVLASDEMEGRGVGTRGIEKAASYIGQRFAEYGLDVQYQSFEISIGAELGPHENQVTLLGPVDEQGVAERVDLELGEGFQPLAIGGSGAVQGDLVFAGYGITSERHQYDDYAGVDVAGKVVLILRKEPQQGNPDSVFAGKRPSRHAFFATKVSNAQEHGAAAVIIVNDQFGMESQARSIRRQFDKGLDALVKLRSLFREEAKPDAGETSQHRTEASAMIQRLAAFQTKLSGDHDELLGLDGAGYESVAPEMPVFFASREKLNRIFRQATGTDLATIEARIDEQLVPQSQLLRGWRVKAAAEIVHKTAKVTNVVGALQGEGPHADESLVVGAHYDHLGHGGTGSLAPWTKEIHNGADDNASGTAAVLEIARDLTGSPNRPARRLVFIAFAGEERGLLGSDHYVGHPLFPLETTVAMINLDMVGRLTDNKLTVYGTGTAANFDALVDELNAKFQFQVSKEPSGFGPSDHTKFYEKQVPVFHFFTGLHTDYHRPSDDVERINFAGMARVTNMITEVVERLANADTRPKYQQQQRRRRRR